MVMREVKKVFARQLRKDQTRAEKVVWELLRDRKFMNYKFRRQHVIEGFVVDFYCPELKLSIEIDGGIHLRRKEYDQLRQEVIESEGITVDRITNDEILNSRRTLLKERLRKIIIQHPSPSPSGRGRQGKSK